MLFTEPMKKIDLLVLKGDLDTTMRYLGFAGCLQLIAESREQRDVSEEERETAELRMRLQSLARFLGMTEESVGPAELKAPDRREIRDRTESLLEETKPLVEEESQLLQRRLNLRQTAEELSAYTPLSISFEELQRSTYLVFRIGSVAPENLDALRRQLSRRALVLPLNRPGAFLAVTPKKGRWALDSELAKLGFQPAQLPQNMRGVPAEMLAAVKADLQVVEDSLKDVQARTRALREAHAGEIRFLLSQLELDAAIDAAKQGLASTGSVQRVTGWVPRRRLTEVVEGLESLTGGRLALQYCDPEELEDVRAGKTKVPVSTPHGRFVRSFERMVFSYSVPLYGSIDPTPFVAVMFVLLFAVMFGDVGQGFVGLLIGTAIASGRVKSLESYRQKHFGGIFIATGLASMASGFLYGSFFANEHVLEPASRAVTQLLLGRPIAHIISLEGFQKIILFFGVTIGIGAVINSIGLIINIVNNIRRRNWEHAIFSNTGLAGAVFFWYVLFVVVRMLLGGHLLAVDVAGLALPLLVLFFREPLHALVSGHRPELKDGLFAFFMGGIAELLESIIYYVSNSVSFLRVAAFALAHTVLSTIIILMSNMVASAPGGLAYQILVLLIGNAIIIVLEGLIVTIQVVRLQYYEFFSKFFQDSGEKFSPFILRSSGGLR